MQQVWQIRQMMALAMLAVCSYTDIKERNIYIMPLLVPAFASAVITAITYIWQGESRDAHLLLEFLVFPLSAGAILIFVVRCLRKHIGEGDALLCTALFIVTGVIKSLYVMMTGSLAAAFYALCVIIFGKRENMGTVPFAPFMMAGYMVILIYEV